ncbi:MAG TPA: general secretion pathway protein GspB [Steroidobacteraceae bacterium]
MSFILDALKKSESDRQRQSGPALFEVKLAPPRTGLPLWAIVIAALLVVNLAIAMWMLLRHSAPRSPDTSAAAPTAGTLPAPSTAAAAAPPPPAAGAETPAPAPAPPALSTTAPTASAPALVPPALLPPVGATNGTGENPDDYAPAADAAAPLFNSRVRRGTADGVALYQDAAATPGTRLPQLRLDLHVFAARPQDRFVMINMHKLREGDSLAEGVHVESITPEGAVLSYNGSRFLLPRE